MFPPRQGKPPLKYAPASFVGTEMGVIHLVLEEVHAEGDC